MTVKFNGKNLPTFAKLVGREISALPDLSVKYMELPRQIGGSFLHTEQGIRKETLEFVLVPSKLSNVDTASIQFADWLRGNDFKPSKIEFDDRSDRYSMAQVNGSTSISDLFIYGNLSVEFLYVDPLSYLKTDLSVTGSSPLNVSYTGDVVQPFTAEFTLTSAATRLTLTNNLAPNKKIDLRGTFASGNKITVDMSKKVILVNSQKNMKVLSLDSAWFNLSKGTNRLTLAVNGTASQLNMTVKSKIAVY